MTGACKVELDKSLLDLPNFSFSLVDFLLLLPSMWGGEIGQQGKMSSEVSTLNVAAFSPLFFSSAIYLPSVPLWHSPSSTGQQKQTCLTILVAAWLTQGVALVCDQPFLVAHKRIKIKTGKSDLCPFNHEEIACTFVVPKQLILQITTIYWAALLSMSFFGEHQFNKTHESSLHVSLQNCGKCFAITKRISCLQEEKQQQHLCHITSFKEGIDYIGCNPNGDVDCLEIFQLPCLLQLARKYNSDQT